jgi:hypothetical protein
VWGCVLVNFLASLALAASTISEQKLQYSTEAGIDSDGNVYVASDGGRPINMATVGHCIEARVADDRQNRRMQRCAGHETGRGDAVAAAGSLPEEW